MITVNLKVVFLLKLINDSFYIIGWKIISCELPQVMTLPEIVNAVINLDFPIRPTQMKPG